MATAEDGSFKPIIRPPRVALTSKAAMAGYIYACEYCEMRFQSMKYLKEHQNKCREQLAKEEAGSEIFTCDFCNREFTCGAFAKSHMRYCNQIQAKQKLVCCYCKNEIKSEDLAMHQKICFAKHENVTYTCSFCGFKSENAVDAKAHADKCRSLKALSYAPRQVLHKCKACGKLFQGKDNFLRHAASCSLSRVQKKVPQRVPSAVKKPATHSQNLVASVKISPRQKRPHSIKQNPDGSMVIVLGERDGAKNQTVGGDDDLVKRARFASAAELEKSSIVIDLRGKKLITDSNNENDCNKDDDNSDKIPETPIDDDNVTEPQPLTISPMFSDDDGPWACKYCKIPFENKQMLSRHTKSCFLGKQRFVLKCPACNMVFGDLLARRNHERVCKLGLAKAKSPGTPSKPSPRKPSDVWNEPLTVPQESTSEPPLPSPATETSSAVVAKRTEKPFACEYCLVPYENQHLLSRHLKSCYLGKQRYSLSCSFCMCAFADLRARMEHEKACGAKSKAKKSSAASDAVAGDSCAAENALSLQASAPDMARLEANRAIVPSVVDRGGVDALPTEVDTGKTGQHRDSAENCDERESEDPPDEEESDDVPNKSQARPFRNIRHPSQKYTCDLCGMENFQQEASLYTHRTFCAWVSQQKVKVNSEKKSTALSISASTTHALFNETMDDNEKYTAGHSSRVKDQDESSNADAANATEVSCQGLEDSFDSSVDDSFSESDGESGSRRLLYVDGTVDSDDDAKQKVRHRRSSKKIDRTSVTPTKKVDRMSVSPKSVGSHCSRGSSIDRGRSKVGLTGKTTSSRELSKAAAKNEIECQCGEKFGSKEAHKTHLRNCPSSKGTSKLKRVKCKNCKKRVKESSLASHLKVCQRTCRKCERQFGNVGALMTHQRACTEGGKTKVKKKVNDSGNVKSKSDPESNVPKPKKITEQKVTEKKTVAKEENREQRQVLKCPKCAHTFQNAGALGKHKLTCLGVSNEKSGRTCAFCKSVFKSRKTALRHQKKCTRNTGVKQSAKSNQAKKSFLCGKCKRYFGNAGALAFHKYSCRGKVEASKTVFQGSAGSVVCPKCKKRFGNVGGLGAHKKFCIVPKKTPKKAAKSAEKSSEKPSGDFPCEYCKKTYASLQALAGHIGFCKYNNVASPKVMPYTCQKCKRGFLSTQLLAVHVKHKMCDKPQTEKKKSVPKVPNKENLCSKCKRTFGSPGALGFHFKTCQGKKPVKFKCKLCSTVSKDAKTYAAHVKVCKAKKGTSAFVTCKYCNGRYPNMQSLGGHIRFCNRAKSSDNTKEDPVFKFTCKLCGMKTKTMGGLTYHMVYFCKKRKGGKVFKVAKRAVAKQSPRKAEAEPSPSKTEVSCQHCGKVFGNGGALGSHVRYCKGRQGDGSKTGKMTLVKNAAQEFDDVHVVYVFICPQCGVKFDNKAQLLEHFVACLDNPEDKAEEGPSDKLESEPQPGTSGVKTSKKPAEKVVQKVVNAPLPANKPVMTSNENKMETEKEKSSSSRMNSPASKQAICTEPCKDCDWGALSAKDNDIQCHKKYCLNNKHSVAMLSADETRPPVKCELCGMEFKSKDSLNIHFKFCKWVKDRKIIDNLPEQEGNSDTTDENETADEPKSEWDGKFATKNVLVPNFVSETDANDTVVYKCEYCGRTSNNKGAVINHVRYCVHRPQHLVSPGKEPSTPTGTTVIDLSHLSAPMS